MGISKKMPANVRPKGSGSSSRNPTVTPMSERQQMALLMQMTSTSSSSSSSVGEVGSRSPSGGAASGCSGPSSSSASTTTTTTTKGGRERNERGETQLHLAAIKGDVEQVCRLLAHSADTNVADFAGWTPLHEACNYGWYEVAYRLVQAGANINAKGLDNDTPLHDAVVNGHLKIAKMLIEKGADLHLKNTKGKSPLDLASPNMVPYLLNTDLPLPESGSSSTSRAPLRSRDDKKISSGSSSEKQKTGASSTSSDAMDNKSNPSAAEDVYEFKSVKDVESSSEKNAEGADSEMEVADPLSVPATNANEESSSGSSNKRNHSEFEGNDDSEKDDENKKKKRKDDNGKESGKAAQRGNNKGQTGKQSSAASSKSGSAKTNTSATDKKSPETSPNPATTTANPSSDAEVENSSNSSDGKTDLKVPPLKIVIPQSSTSEQDTGTSRNGKNNSQRAHQALPYVVPSSNSNDSADKDTNSTGTNSPETVTSVKETEKKEPPNNQNEEPATTKTEPEPAAPAATTSAPPPPAPVHVELHPRKRKMKQSREQTNAQQADNADSSAEAREVHPHEQPITNCYKLFMNIRKQIEKRRKGLFLVQPKPPQGFKDYLMNRCTYVLANTAPTTPNITYPPTLPAQLKDLFADQEKERYRLRMQHVIEKEKLVLSVEQEILRVHGRAARALANQSLPFSVCTILRDEEVYNLITPEQEEKDRNARSRYNGRLFLSWLQDVDDKWEKIKEHMLLRHHHEAESLHAVQKMNWEWKLKELSMCDKKSTPKIDELHVPEVHVSDDFDLLPA